MKVEVPDCLQVLVDEFQEMDPKFPISEVKSLLDFRENVYAKDAPPEVATSKEKVGHVDEKENKTFELPQP